MEELANIQSLINTQYKYDEDNLGGITTDMAYALQIIQSIERCRNQYELQNDSQPSM